MLQLVVVNQLLAVVVFVVVVVAVVAAIVVAYLNTDLPDAREVTRRIESEQQWATTPDYCMAWPTPCWFDERLARIQSIKQSFRSPVEAVQFRQAYYCLHWNGTEVCNAFNAMDDAHCIKCNEPNSYWVAERQAGLWGESEASFTWKHRQRTARGNLISEHCLEGSKQDCLKPLTVLSINLARCSCHNVPNHIAYWHLFLRCLLRLCVCCILAHVQVPVGDVGLLMVKVFMTLSIMMQYRPCGLTSFVRVHFSTRFHLDLNIRATFSFNASFNKRIFLFAAAVVAVRYLSHGRS